MKVALTFLPQLVGDCKYELWTSPPLALYVLAACLEEKGHNVRVVDPCEYFKFDEKENIIENTADYLSSQIAEYEVVCFSCNTFNWGFSKIVVEMVYNRFPHKHYVTGGLHPTLFDKYSLDNSKFMYVVRGEGEKVLPSLLTAIENDLPISSVRGVSYCGKDGEIIRNVDANPLTLEELEASPLPDFKYLDSDNTYYAIPVESSRGCAFSCAFCSIPHRHNWRGISPQITLNRIEKAILSSKGKIKSKDILFTDDCLTINTKRAKELMEQLYNTYGYEYSFFLEVRVSSIISDDLLQVIRPGMITSMQIGVEAGYDEGLKKIKKGINLSQLFEALDIIYANGFTDKCFLSFIIGFPWEGEEEINKTIDTVERILRIYHISISLNWLIMLPSDLWKERDFYHINADESIYDNPRWAVSQELFFQTHPRLNRDIVERVEDRIEDIKQANKRLRFTYFGSRKIDF